MFEKEFQEWFEGNKKWLYSSDHMQAAYHAWCAGVQQQQAVEQSVQPTLLRCGFTDCNEEVRHIMCSRHYDESQSG